MTTAVRNDPQAAFGENVLEDGTLESLLEERETAKAAYDDAKGYLEDYIGSFIQPGDYRVGRFRLKVTQATRLSISIPKPKRRR